ncbi:ATP-binding protein [Spirillospora sp. CA-255316]
MMEAESGFRPSLCVDRGGCAAMRLPPDETIAHAARTGTGETLEGFDLGLSADTIDNATLMASELATNALRHGVPRTPDGAPSLAHPVELWIYARHGGDGRDRSELVVKVFDGSREWRGTAPAGPDAPAHAAPADDVPARDSSASPAHNALAPPVPAHPTPASAGDEAAGLSGALAEHGRGLLIVDALSQGRWGHHLTRSRLGDPAVPGKATWFGLPIPALRRPAHTGAARAAEDLHALLVRRGIRRLIRRNERGVSVLSVKQDLTVWCEGGSFHWRVPGGGFARLPRADITEACEQIVELYESLSRERAGSLHRTG